VNSLETIEDTNSSFTTMGGAAISGDNIGFWTFLPFSGFFEGIYEHTGGAGGSYAKIADEDDTVFGLNSPLRFYTSFNSSRVDQDGGETAFLGEDTTGGWGIYSTIFFGGGLFAIPPRVYSGRDEMPGTGELFDLTFTPAISFDGGDIALKGQNDDQSWEGVYLFDSSVFDRFLVADLDTPASDSGGEFFDRFFMASVDGDTDNVAFLAEDGNGDIGLYARIDCVIGKVIGTGNDDLEIGKEITDLGFGHEGFDGNSGGEPQAVFLAHFDDGSQEIYVAHISFDPPVPGDVNGDELVTLVDLIFLFDLWLEEGRCLPGDFNKDEIIDLLDFVVMALAWP